jgi:hypothetical protein
MRLLTQLYKTNQQTVLLRSPLHIEHGPFKKITEIQKNLVYMWNFGKREKAGETTATARTMQGLPATLALLSG